ncbi:uncharacterized protein LOC127565410 [Drosophila albomicans]|uniref:Uncharacterized protein LOC127565410 n=1 Tax=Drosophila albomicans TaxID=7291 RepID=A0A9C6STB2_DROAB|nr:uncharacterized protein LOC127565410 [Drosophila albomicans]
MRDKRPMNDVTVNVILFKISKTYRIPLFDESLDFCAFMGDTAVAKMLSFINKQFMKLTNANHSCPYQHDIIYYGTKNEQFLTEIPAPKGNYILQMKVAANKKWKAHVKFFATVY